MSEGQIVARNLPAHLSVKDVIAHLRAWQQISIARLEAALLNREPVLPELLGDLDPESDEDLEPFNARIHDAYLQQAWSRVLRDWREGFLKFLDLAAKIPERDLSDAAKYPWLKGYSLLTVLQGSYDHHHADHFEPLLAWIRQRGNVEGQELSEGR